MNDLISKIGFDKIAHFGIGGWIGAFLTFMFILQEGNLSNGMLIASPTVGVLVVFVLSFLKEAIVDSVFSWKDIIASIAGAASMYIAVALGVLFNILSN